ncbi:MAG: hypothetical protein IKV97_05785, partial [Clostridia bacterium]|nr:hypothetical protein [Clostridia bacterium]
MAYLVLSNGKTFECNVSGIGYGKIGELMTLDGPVGYTEALTDSANEGKFIVWTFPSAGNYGVCEEDFKSGGGALGIIARELCDTPSNFRCDYSLEKLLCDRGMCGIFGVDTREIATFLRDEGRIFATVCEAIPEDIPAFFEKHAKSAQPSGENAVSKVSPTSHKDTSVRKVLVIGSGPIVIGQA